MLFATCTGLTIYYVRGSITERSWKIAVIHIGNIVFTNINKRLAPINYFWYLCYHGSRTKVSVLPLKCKCRNIHQLVNKMWTSHRMECIVVSKKKEPVTDPCMLHPEWTQNHCSRLGEGSQMRKTIYCLIPFVCNVQKVKSKKREESRLAVV